MLDIADLLVDPEAYVCIWRDGELYVELLIPHSAATTLN